MKLSEFFKQKPMNPVEALIEKVRKHKWRDPDEGLELRPEVVERLKRGPSGPLLTLDEMMEKLELEENHG